MWRKMKNEKILLMKIIANINENNVKIIVIMT